MSPFTIGPVTYCGDRLVHFVVVMHPTRGRCILMSTDTSLHPMSWWSLWRYAIPFLNFSWLTPTAITLRNSSPKDKTLIEWTYSALLMGENSVLSQDVL